MSTVVDSKVVEMTFDNKQFERETKNTMKTLDQLKKELNFDQSVKSLDSLNKAAQKVDFSGMAKSIDQVSVKLSAMEIIGTTALVNLTNKVVNAGEKLVKSMTIDQVTAGWQKYADKTASVQTLLNSTGKSLGEINKYLATLQWYSDETSYGFTDMTQALSTMTIAGGKIEKLIPMIMGVANATAFAGKGPAQFKSIMYNLSQSYSKGSLQTIDWKSVTLMGGASVQLKEALMQSAKELKKIKKDAKSTDFDTYLSDHVFTNDVMERAFDKFSDYTVLMKEIIDDYTENESAFSHKISATTLNSELIPAIMKLKKEGKMDDLKKEYSDFLPYLSKIEKVYNSLGDAAFHSAQEAKTFSEAIEATKDAVSSQFAQIFEAIFGDYYKAKKLWTDFVNWLYDLIVAPLESLREKIEKIMAYKPVSELRKFADTLKKVGVNTDSTAKSLEYYQKMVNKIWRGDYKNQPYRKGLLEKEGHDFKVLQNLVNLGYRHKLTTEEVAAAEKKYGKGIVDNAKNLDKMSDKQLRALGLTEEQVKLYRQLSKEAKTAGLSLNDYISQLADAEEEKILTGRELFIGIFTNIGNAITSILNAIGEAFNKAFGKNSQEAAESAYTVLSALYGITKRISDFFDKDRKRYDKNGKELKNLNNAYTNIVNTLKGFFGILSLIASIMKIGIKIAFGVVSGVLKAFGFTLDNILDVTGAVGEAIFNISKFIEKSVIGTVVNALVDILVSLIDVVVELLTYSNPLFDVINKIKNAIMGFFKGISEYLKGDKAKKVLSDIGKTLGTILSSTVILLGNVISKTINWITHNKVILSIIDAIQKAFTNAAKAIHDWIKSGEAGNAVAKAFTNLGKAIVWVINTMAKGINALIKWARNSKTLQKIIKTLGEYLSIMFKTIGKWLSKIDFVSIFTKIGKTIYNIGVKVKNWIVNNTKLVDTLKSVWEWLKKSADSFATWFSGIKNADNIPKYIISGLVNGLKNGLSAIITAVGTLASGIIKTFAKLLGIHSPSKVFFDFGKYIIIGLINGIKEMFPMIIEIIKSLGQSIINVFKELNIGSVIAGLIAVGSVITLNKVSTALLNFSKPFDAIGGILRSFKTTVTELNKTLGALQVSLYADAAKTFAIAIAILVGCIYVLTKLNLKRAWSAAYMLMALIGVLGGVLIAITKFTSFSGPKDLIKVSGLFASIASVMISIGASVILIAIGLKMLDKVNATSIKIGIGIAVIIIGAVAGLITVASKMNYGSISKAQQLFSSIKKLFISLSIIIIATAYAMKIVSKIDPNRMENLNIFIKILAVLLGGVAAIMVAISKIQVTKIKELKKVEGLIKSLAILIIAIAFCAKILGNLSNDAMTNAEYRLIWIGSFIVGLVGIVGVINKFTGNGLKNNATDSLMKIAGVIAILTILTALLGLTPKSVFKSGIAKVAIVEGLALVLYYFATKIDNESTGIKNSTSKNILNIAAAVILLGAAAIVLGLMPLQVLIKGVIAVGVLSFIVARLLETASQAKPSAFKMIASMALLIAVVAASVVVLGNMPIGKMLLSAGVIILLMGALIGIFEMIGKMSKDMTPAKMKGVSSIIVTLALIIIAIAIAISIISEFGGSWDKILASAVGIGIVLYAVVKSLDVINKMKVEDYKDLFKKLGVLALLVLATVVIAYVLSKVATGNSFGNLIGASLAIGILLAVLVGALYGISKTNMNKSNMLKTIGALAVLVIAVVAIAFALSLIKNTNNTIESAIAISILLIIMTGVLAVLGAISNLVSKALIGVIGLLALTVVVIGLAYALSIISSIPNAIETITQLSTMLIVMTGVLAVLTVIGLAGPAALIGIGSLVVLIAAIVGMAEALGHLIKDESKLVKGLDILVLIAGKVGEAIAAFVGAIMDMILKLLPKLGLALSQFAINATPFILTMKLVNKDVLEGVGILTAAILALCVAKIFDTITKIFSFGKSFAELGKELSQFARNAEDFIKFGKNIPDNLAKNMLNLAKAMLAIAAGDFLDKLSQKLFGGGSAIQRFADNLPILGEGLRDFVDKLGTFNDDTVKTVDCASQAIASLAKASGKIPRSGGWIQKLIGEKNIKNFGKSLGQLGIGLATFRAALGNKFTKTDAEVVDNAANAVSSMAQAAEKIPRSGGEWQKKYGGKDLGAFANDIGDTGAGLKVFRDKIKPFTKTDMEHIKFGAQMIEQFASAAAHILVSADGFTYDESDKPHLEAIQAFANDLPSFGTGLTELFKELPSSNNVVQYAEKIKNFETMTKFLTTVEQIIQETQGYDAEAGYVLHLGDVRSAVIGFLRGFGTGIKDFASDMDGVNIKNVDKGFDIISKTISFIERVIKINILNLSKFNSEMSKMLGGTFIDSISTILESLKDDSFKLNKDEQYWKNLSAFSQAVGQTIVENVSKGLDDSMAVNQIASSLYRLLSSVFDLFIGQISGKDSLKDMIKTYNTVALANFGQQVVQAICNGIDSDNSKKTILESLNFVGDYLKDNIKKVKLDNIAVDDFRLTISKLKVTFGDETEELKKKIKENLESEFDKILKSINLGTTMTLTPVIDATISWDSQTEQKFKGLLTANTALSNNVNALKNSFATDLTNQTTRIVNKLDEVNKSVKDIDSSENYTINIDGKVLASNNEINTIVKDLTKALEKHYKTGNTGGA